MMKPTKDNNETRYTDKTQKPGQFTKPQTEGKPFQGKPVHAKPEEKHSKKDHKPNW